jgi:hypothetical protein
MSWKFDGKVWTNGQRIMSDAEYQFWSASEDLENWCHAALRLEASGMSREQYRNTTRTLNMRMHEAWNAWKSSSSFRCRICGIDFPTKEELDDHMWRKHGAEVQEE